jgi:hypothetical protein
VPCGTERLPRNGFHGHVILQLTVCPEQTCQLPAEITDRFVLSSTDGPIEHVMVHCVARHISTVPVDRLVPTSAVRQ